MKIDRSLKLVIPMESGALVHCTPVGREVFEQFFMVLGKTFTAVFAQGMGAFAGPRVAYLMLKQVASEMGIWAEVEKGFINEVIRLTNVAIPGEKGWQTLPLHVAYEREVIDAEDRQDIEGELVFFTLVALMNKRAQVVEVMEAVGGLWGSQTTSLGFTEYRNSLTTLTAPASSGENAEKVDSLPMPSITPADPASLTSFPR